MNWEAIVERAKILIVDDEQGSVRVMERMLEQAGYTNVYGTTDAREVSRLRALLLGAKDVLLKPVDRLEAMLRFRNLLQTRFLFRELTEEQDPLRGLRQV